MELLIAGGWRLDALRASHISHWQFAMSNSVRLQWK